MGWWQGTSPTTDPGWAATASRPLAAGRRQDPDWQLLVDDIVTQDDLVIGQVTPVGGPVSESRIVILRVRDSQVAEYWSLAYRAALGQQLGLRGGTAGGARLGV
jgi:hypothetical protein